MPTGSGNLVVVGSPVPSGDPGVLAAAAAVGAAADRTAGGDELAIASADPATRRHLSPTRADLLVPVHLGTGDRVLELGAGTGAITRRLGERGASVVAVEADLDAARVVQRRAAGLDVAVVVAGLAEAMPLVGGGYDLVLLLDLPPDGAAPAIAAAAGALGPDGVLVVAAANPVGVHRLASAPSADELGSWLGRGDGTRVALGARLAAEGLGEQRWLSPFPDHVLPTAIVTDEVLAAGSRFDRVVPDLLPDDGRTALVVGDVRDAYASLRAAGLGPALAPSVLVVAGRTEAAVAARVDPAVLAWLPGGHRRQAWRRAQEVRATGGGLELVTAPPPRERPAPGGWLVHRPGGHRAFVDGTDVATAATACCRAGDEAGLVALLRSWADATPSIDPGGRRPHHPFADDATTAWAPGECLDVALAGFVVTPDGLVRVEPDLAAGAPVDRDLVRFRALWHFARRLVVGGVRHPWPLELSVDGIALGLAERAGVPVDEATLGRFRDADRAFLGAVSLLLPEAIDAYLSPDRSVAAEHAARRASLADALHGAVGADRRRAEAERRAEVAEAAAADLAARVATLDGEVLRLTSEWYSMKAAVVIAEQARLDAVEGRDPVAE